MSSNILGSFSAIERQDSLSPMDFLGDRFIGRYTRKEKIIHSPASWDSERVFRPIEVDEVGETASDILVFSPRTHSTPTKAVQLKSARIKMRSVSPTDVSSRKSTYGLLKESFRCTGKIFE